MEDRAAWESSVDNSLTLLGGAVGIAGGGGVGGGVGFASGVALGPVAAFTTGAGAAEGAAWGAAIGAAAGHATAQLLINLVNLAMNVWSSPRTGKTFFMNPRDLPLPPGINNANEFGDFIGWGTKVKDALARNQNITAEEIEQMAQNGLTPDMAQTWAQYLSVRGRKLW